MSYFTNFPKFDYDIDNSGTTQNVTNITSYVAIKSKQLDNIAFYSHYVIPDGHRPDNVSYTLYGTDKYYWTFFVINPELTNYYTDWPKDSSKLLEYIDDKYPYLAALSSNSNLATLGLKVGETVEGLQSGARGKIVHIYPTAQWLLIKPTSGTFKSTGESIKGSSSEAFCITYSITKHVHAPHHFVDKATGEIVNRSDTHTTKEVISYYEVEQEENLKRSKIRVIKPEFIEEVSDLFIEELNKSIS
jgi:hypothetical protein